MNDQLKKQTKVKADIIVDFGSWKFDMSDCIIYANSSNSDELVALFQDKNDPTKKIQITLKPSTNIQSNENSGNDLASAGQ